MTLSRCELHCLQYDTDTCPQCDADNPFFDWPRTERVHVVIGTCAGCSGEAHLKLRDRVLCYPCAYNEAN